MEPVKVPQHLELEDVIAWGLGAVDLACIAAGSVIGWWVWTFAPGPMDVRIAAATPFVAIGAGLGALRFHGQALREWAVLVGSYLTRPRLLLIAVRRHA